MARVVVGLMVLAAGVTMAQAQVRSVNLVTPRLFGYFVGDVIRSEVDIVVDNGTDLVPASVPQPGPLNAWLELVDSRIEQGSTDDGKLYRLFFAYQNFYPALDSRELDVPGFALSFRSGDKTISAQVPGWSFLISSLREVLPPPKASGAAYMQADVTPPFIGLHRYRVATFGFFAACLAALVFLAYHLALWPFARRPNRPFTEAARRIRRQVAGADGALDYRDALLTLHRAVDATAGHAVFAEDLPEFLDRAPAFSPLKDDFNLFFRSSRQVFFGDDVAAARAEFNLGELSRFSERLAAAERAA
jgi:mxaA protein